MDLNEYQKKAAQYAKYMAKDYPFLALTEEVGEVSGKLAKYSRKNNCTLSSAIADAHGAHGASGTALREDLKKELGDVLWQLSACCVELGVTLEHIAQLNLDKLSDRAERGVIIGEGDKR